MTTPKCGKHPRMVAIAIPLTIGNRLYLAENGGYSTEGLSEALDELIREYPKATQRECERIHAVVLKFGTPNQKHRLGETAVPRDEIAATGFVDQEPCLAGGS